MGFITLGSIASIKGGKRLPAGVSLSQIENDHPYIRVRDLNNVRILEKTEDIEYVDDETQKSIARYIVDKGDIVISIVGTIGLIAIVGDSLHHANLTENCVRLTDISKDYDSLFLYYYLISELCQDEIKKRTVGAVQPKLPLKNIAMIPVPIIDLQTQKRIAGILSSLDDKIEVNNQINRNLEEQAKAIFKSWFVDFEPFKDGKFVDSELGRIPKGWKTGKFTDVVQILGGGTPKTSIPEYWNGMIPFFTPKDVGDSIYTFATEKNLTEEGLNNCNSRLYPENTVFVTARGTVGKLALAGVPMAMNQSCYALVGKNVSPLFVFFLALQVVETLKKIANGAVFDAIVTRDFETKSIIIPPEEAINRFVELIAPIFKMIHSNVIQNTTLVQSCDTLLPKLMSGEIDF